jgi:translation initiation factor 2B subunit (eIF-2B alpha/beta/delta family)
LLGADRIATSGTVSNKTGSLPAVLSARHVPPAVKVVVLRELEKVAEHSRPDIHVVEENDSVEVVSGWRCDRVQELEEIEPMLQSLDTAKDASASLGVKKLYFEWAPSELVNAYVCQPVPGRC